MEAIETIKKRRSVRNFTDREVPRELIEQLVDAGRLAATARNVQPWEFVVATDRKMREQLSRLAEYGKFIAESPVCIAVLCQDTKYYLEDGSAATENILLAATAAGLGSCWVAGDKKTYAGEVCRLLGAAPKYKLISLIAIGYPGQKGGMPPKRSLKEVIHWEKF